LKVSIEDSNIVLYLL
jgi:hypothetical protein